MYTRVARDAFYTFAVTVANTAIGFLSSVLIAYNLGPDAQGVLKVVLLLPALLYTFLNLGVESSILYYGSLEKCFASMNRLTARITLLFLLGSAAAGAAAIWLGGAIFHYYDGIPLEYLFAVVPLAPLSFYLSMQTVLIRSENNYRKFNLVSIARQAAYVAAALCVLAVKSPWTVIAANYFAVIVGIALCKAGAKHGNSGGVRLHRRGFLKYGLKSYFSSIINFVNYRFDLVYLTPLESKQQIGLYSVAQSLSELIWAIPNSVSVVLLPRTVTMGRDEKTEVYLRMSRYISTVMVAVVVLAMLAAGSLIPLVYSSRYAGAVLPFKLLLAGTFFMTYAKIFGNAIAAMGLPEKNIYANAAGSVANVIANIILIPQYGIIGAAIAGSISYSVSGVVSVIVFLRLNRGRARLTDMLVVNREDIAAVARVVNRKLARRRG